MVSLKYSVAADKSTTQRKRKHEVSRSAEDFKLNNSEPAKSSSSSRRKFLLPDFEVPVEIRTTYIVWGYRYWRLSARECLQSLFHTTNETINVWSHAVAFVLFAVRFSTVFSWQDHDQVLNPLLAFAFSILLLMAASSTAHLFNCISLRAHHIGFYFDYAAINCYAFGGAMLYFFYSRPLGEEAPLIFKSAPVFHIIAAVLCILCTAVMCISRHRCSDKWKYVIRTLAVAVNFLYDISPYIYRWLFSQETDTGYDLGSLHYFKRHLICYLVSAIANATKLPERLIPGVFDFLGQSHHFLHVLSAMGAADAFTTAQIDLKGRRDALMQFTPEGWFENCLLWMAVVFALNFALVGLMIALGMDRDLEDSKSEVFMKTTNEHQE